VHSQSQKPLNFEPAWHDWVSLLYSIYQNMRKPVST